MTFVWPLTGLGLVVGACTAGAPLAPGGPASLDFERVDVPVGSRTSAVLAAALDADEHLDLLVAGAERVLLLRGRGDGRFDLVDSLEAGEQPTDLALADLDEDGALDVAVANHDTDYVTLLFGKRAGGFETRGSSRFTVDVSPHPHAVRLSDLDRDGHADLLVDDRNGEGVRLFRGRGDGGFEPSQSIPVGGDPYRGMVLADLDADGALDLVTPNPDHVSVSLGDGAGGFTRHATLRPSFAPFAVAAADFDGDGTLDVAAGSGEGRGALAVWFGTPAGTFRAGEEHVLGAGPTRLAAADLDGDGRAEVLATSYAGGEIAVLTGGKTPQLHRMEVAGHPYGLTTGDFDGDGATDFAVANDGEEQLTVFLSRE